MQRIAVVLTVVLAMLVAGCSGAPPTRVFPPEASVQELRTAGSGDWTVVLRLRNFSTVPMQFGRLQGSLRFGDERVAVDLDAGLQVPPNSVDPVEYRFTPSAALRERAATVLANRHSLRYVFEGSVTSNEPSRRFDVTYESLLNPVPGLDGVFR